MFDASVLDAFIGGLSTAFFGSLVAGGAYLLRTQLALREQVDSLKRHVAELSSVQASMGDYGGARVKEKFKEPQVPSGGDADA